MRAHVLKGMEMIVDRGRIKMETSVTLANEGVVIGHIRASNQRDKDAVEALIEIAREHGCSVEEKT